MQELIRSTREQIAEVLREEILCGRRNEGERLGEVELAKRFGVSRGPIREALAELYREGLVLAKPNRGYRVASPAPDAIREFIMPVRRAIETYALKLVFDKLNERDFQGWDEILLRMERACRLEDVDAVAGLDIAVHRHLLRLAAQPDLLAIWQTIVARVRSHFWKTVMDMRADLMRVHAHHVELVAAFRSGNVKKAVKTLEEHIRD
jgi:DNA-binding GntR family transcriptional regulator